MAELLATILLVEDDMSDSILLKRGFDKAGVLNPISHLKDGDEALAFLAGVEPYVDREKFPLPALILLDLKLPGMTGLQLLQWMRAQRDVRRIPVVVLTSSDDLSTVNAAYDAGASSYLVKPGDSAAIVKLVHAIRGYWIELNQPPQLVMRART